MKEVSFEISAQPSFLRLFFKDSLVPMTACCQAMPLVGFFLFLAPLPTSHSATLQGPRPSRRRIPHLLSPHPRAFSAPRCSLAARLQACCILLPAMGFASFPPRFPTRWLLPTSAAVSSDSRTTRAHALRSLPLVSSRCPSPDFLAFLPLPPCSACTAPKSSALGAGSLDFKALLH